MSELTNFNRSAYPQFSNEKLSLTRRSGAVMNEAEYGDLQLLMGQMCDRYPNQTLLPGTTDIFLKEWEEMGLRYGLETFQDALLKALRESAFFPDPSEIRTHCAAIDLQKFDAAEKRRKIAAREAKERDMREHPEEYGPIGKQAERQKSNGTA